VPSPSGRDWLDGTIRGLPGRGDAVLRNPAHTGRAVWNRFRRETNPLTGASVRRPKALQESIRAAFPAFRIVPAALWQAAHARLAAEAVATHPQWQPAVLGTTAAEARAHQQGGLRLRRRGVIAAWKGLPRLLARDEW
jgi:hypothetical protein